MQAQENVPFTIPILKSIGLVGALTIAVKIVGFVEKQFLAYLFGAGEEVDAYWIAQSVPFLIYFLVQGITAPAILPQFVRKVSGGDIREAWNQASLWFLVFFGFSLLMVLPLWWYAESLVKILGPGLNTNQAETCVRLIRIAVPAAVGLGALPLCFAILDANKRFGVPRCADLVLKIGPVLAMVAVWKKVGIDSALYGLTAASFVALSICFWFLVKPFLKSNARPNFNDPDTRYVAFLMLAPGLGMLVSQFGTIAENAIASQIGIGSISALNFAKKIVNLPLLVVPFSVATVLYPYFSELHYHRGSKESMDLFGVGMRAMLFLFLPLVIFTCVLREPIVRLVYQRGLFDSEATAQVTLALLWLAPTMCLYAVEMILLRYFFSKGTVWSPIAVGMGCVAVRVFMALALIPNHGLSGLAAAILGSRVLKVGLLLALTDTETKSFLFGIQGLETLKLAFSAALGGMAIRFLVTGTPMSWPDSTFGTLGTLVFGTLIGGGVYLASAYLIGSTDCRHLLRALVHRKP